MNYRLTDEMQMKVTLIRRLVKATLLTTQVEFLSNILGCEVPQFIIDYVVRSTDDMIAMHLIECRYTAIELEKLNPIWR
jgi:predicted RecB family endonuclease